MAHAPQFLKLVNEAKKKINETNVADVKRRGDAGEKFLLVDVREDNEEAQPDDKESRKDTESGDEVRTAMKYLGHVACTLAGERTARTRLLPSPTF